MAPRLSRFHRLADDLVARAFRAGILYRSGFGDRDGLAEMVRAVAEYTRETPYGEGDLRWTKSEDGGRHRDGTFESPTTVPLPPEARQGVLELWSPVGTERGPACLVLAATGEEGFFRRRRLARTLVGAGITAVLLENPYYGARRPRGQHGPALRTVFDQFAMNLATVDEARFLLHVLRARGYGPVGVTGYSQGGFMSAFAASLVDFPVVAVPRAAGTSAEVVFTESALSHGVHWPALAREVGSEERARRELASMLRVVDLTKHPAPIDTNLATIVVSRHDRFVPPADGEALHRHWAGSHLVWSEGGHVTSSVFDGSGQARAIIEAFRRAK